MNEDVFPIENGDIPVSYVTLPEGNLNKKLGGGFKDFLYFHPKFLGKMHPFWRAYFSKGWGNTTN